MGCNQERQPDSRTGNRHHGLDLDERNSATKETRHTRPSHQPLSDGLAMLRAGELEFLVHPERYQPERARHKSQPVGDGQ